MKSSRSGFSRLFLFAIVPFAAIAAAGSLPGLSASGPDAPVRGKPPLIEVRDDRLTVRLDEVPWAIILRELQRQTGLTFRMESPLEGTVTRTFEALPLEKGLRSLLSEVDFVFLYASKGSASKLTEVRIFGRREGSMVETARPSHQPFVTNDPVGSLIKDTLTAEKEESREQVAEVLIQALKNQDATVRERAATALADLQDEAAVDYLSEALREDVNEGVRESVVYALGDVASPQAIEALGRALEDKSANVRESAADALARIGRKRIVEALKRTLGHGDKDAAEAAAEVLQFLTGKKSRD